MIFWQSHYAVTGKKHKNTIFEVNSKFRHSYEPNQKYRYVGTGAVKALQKVYQSGELWCESVPHALKFWSKNGFTRIDNRELFLHWYQK